MSVDVKKVKRVLTSNSGSLEPLKVMEVGVNKPAFRQNGYELSLDSANADYIKTNFVETEVLVDDLDIEVSFRGLVYNGSSVQQIFNSTFAPAVNSNYLYIRVQDSNNIRVSIGAVSASVSVDLSTTNTVRLDGQDLYVNGVFIQTIVSNAPLITFYEWTLLGASKPEISQPVREFLDGTILSLRLQGETFNFTESRGNTTTGSNGTTATINTSHASGIQYLDSTVWNKKSFGLIGDPLYNEKITVLGVDYPLTNIPITELEHLGESFDLTEGLGNELFGSNGGLATINTSHAEGIDRINYGMWQKGDDTNGWNPYT